MSFPPDQYGPPHAYNDGVLQNGYQLQHYRYAGNDALTGFDRLEALLRTASDEELQRKAFCTQQTCDMMDQIPALRRELTTKQDDLHSALGLPRPPNSFELLMMGDRAAALAAIERYKQDYKAAMERKDPGGLNSERVMELMDRRIEEHSMISEDLKSYASSIAVERHPLREDPYVAPCSAPQPAHRCKLHKAAAESIRSTHRCSTLSQIINVIEIRARMPSISRGRPTFDSNSLTLARASQMLNQMGGWGGGPQTFNNNFMQQQPRQQDSSEDVRFKGSTPLRVLLLERLEGQLKYLNDAEKRIEHLIAIGRGAEAAEGGQGHGPGDEQISGKQIKMMEEMLAQNEGLHPRAAMTPGGIFGVDPQPYRDMLPRRFDHVYGVPGMTQQNAGTAGIKKERDPLEKYQYVDKQICILLNMSTVQQQQEGAVNPYQIMADQFNKLANPRKAYQERLERVLGPNGGAGGGGGRRVLQPPGNGELEDDDDPVVGYEGVDE